MSGTFPSILFSKFIASSYFNHLKSPIQNRFVSVVSIGVHSLNEPFQYCNCILSYNLQFRCNII